MASDIIPGATGTPTDAAAKVTPLAAARRKRAALARGQTSSAGAAVPPKFGDIREILLLQVGEALAICHVVSLATAALMDHSVDFDDSAASRWHPSIEEACEKLREVGAALSEISAAPAVDWWTPLNLLEALSAALWHCSGPADDAIEQEELRAFLRRIIALMDNLVEGLRHG